MKKSDKGIILMLIGILLALASYFFVYQKLTEETAVMKTANAELQAEVDRLQDLANNKEQYIADTETMKAEIEEIIAQFPAQYLPEDEILYMISTENTHDAWVTDLNMGMTTVVEVAVPSQDTAAETTEVTEEAAATEVTTEEAPKPEIMLYRTPVSSTSLSSYTSIKDIIKQINDDKNRKSIDTVSVAFDSETGELLSTIAMSMYSLTGTEAEYKTPSVDGITYGTNDIFNSAKKKSEIQAAKARAAAATE